jgi:hypothetical protein
MRVNFKGIMQPVWSDTSSFLNAFYEKKNDAKDGQ